MTTHELVILVGCGGGWACLVLATVPAYVWGLVVLDRMHRERRCS